MKFEKLYVGQVLYDVHSHLTGMTKCRTLGVWAVKIISIDTVTQTAMVSWNSNRPEKWGATRLSKLKAKQPTLIANRIGGKRRPTKEEIALLKQHGITSGTVYYHELEKLQATKPKE